MNPLLRICCVLLLFCSPASADDFPNKPLTLVVAFGVGGSADRMSRLMAPYLADELGQPVQVINKKGAGTLLGNNYLLSKPHDGYTILASAFSPYLSNTILDGNATYTVDDFAYLNFQWFDEDLLATYRDSRFQSLAQVLDEIRAQPKTVRAAVVRGSTGHLMLKLLLELHGIPQSHLNLVTYNDGGTARAAVAGGVVDIIMISAKGTEGIREYIRPLAINSDRERNEWGAPTVVDALRGSGATIPVLPGSIRGFAVSAETRKAYPQRFERIASAIQRVLAREEVQARLAQQDIGGRWTGEAEALRIMRGTFDVFRDYSHLLSVL